MKPVAGAVVNRPAPPFPALPGTWDVSRRTFLRESLRAAGALALGAGALPGTPREALAGRPRPPKGAANYGALQAADANGIRLPVGFSSRVVAMSGQAPAQASSHVWHGAPDGGAVFPADPGWIYVSNSEVSGAGGGVSALRMDAAGDVVDAYPILTGTSTNCAGGHTPWGTWLSCEETGSGEVWECDPTAPSQGLVKPAMGSFKHEAAAVDPFHGHIYLTEDRSDSLLYRFTPSSYPDLSTGLLEAAEVLGSDPFTWRSVIWHEVPDPNPSGGAAATRDQVPEASPFNGGEGIFYDQGIVYFTTKGDNRVWQLDTFTQRLNLLYDKATSPNPILSGVDNVMVTPVKDVFVAEDGGDLEIVALTRFGTIVPVLQVTGQGGSEITGPALSPDGTRLYFSSQRGTSGAGITYEVSGPFLA